MSSGASDRSRITPASRFEGIELSLIRQIQALATPASINLGLGEPNLEPDEHLLDLARNAATEGDWRYTPNAGSSSLRRAIADATGIVEDQEVCVTAGTQEGLFATLLAFVNPGDEVLLPDPGFVAYPTVVRLVGGIPVPYPLDPGTWRLDPASIRSRVTRRTRAIIVNSPSNPTGAVATAEALAEVAELADQRHLLVVSDEVYRELYDQALPPTMLGLTSNAITLQGLSKSHGITGLRIGWAIGNRALMPTIIKAHQFITTCASSFSQRLAEMILNSGEWNAGWLARARQQIRDQREVALSAIESHLDTRIQRPDGAFYLFTPIPRCDSLSLARELATIAGVLTIPGIAFGGAGEGFLRISCAADPGTLVEGISRIGRHLGR
ncbi:MAG TPA: pyridoxal phosphate-dependent aminotransferase [Thermoanaerobaculia bacterium]|nr:pyridoxal phosphate-dependent aminotransferase [Thermoanaerobaculia bacterium]